MPTLTKTSKTAGSFNELASGRLFAILLFFFFCNLIPAGLWSQDLTVTGRILSADDGKALPGVNVVVKRTGAGTVTNADGDYTIGVKQDFFSSFYGDTLVFSFTGFRTLEMAVSGQNRINAMLEPQIFELNEVIVTGTAAGVARKNMSYAVGYLDRESVARVPSASLGGGFQGKVPGLRVSSVGGQPGQGVFLQVRAANAIANGQQPLIIVDGVFLQGTTLADFHPEDIERVEILKGSAGTSLYGSQAANGVIQVFTKRGRDLEVGNTRVVYRGEAGFSETVKHYDINRNTNLEIIDPDGPQPILGNPTASDLHDTPLPNFHDYQSELLFRQGVFQSHYIGVESKGPRTNFLASVQRLRDQGIMQTSDGYTRNSFRFNMDHDISSKLSVRLSSLYAQSEQDLIDPVSNGPSSFLASVLFLTPMFDLDVANEEDGSPYDWDIDNTGLGTTNPRYSRANSRQSVNRSRWLGSLGANYYLNDWLTLNYVAALDYSLNRYTHFVEKGYLSNNIPGLFGPLVTAGVQGSAGGGIHRSWRQGAWFTSRFNAIVRKKMGALNTAICGSFLYEDLNAQFDEGLGENLAVAGLHTLDNARSNIIISSEAQQIVAYSGFVVADIDYKQKYIFSGLLRREGSSLFGPDNRWANYYRLSSAYRLTEDLRIKGIQELKIRASIGTSGLRPAFEQRFETFELINGVITKNTLGNKALKPSLSTETEIGVDMAFARAFKLGFSYAKINTSDQILLTPLSGAAGFSAQWRNAGLVEAEVYEAGLLIDFKKLFRMGGTGFRWELNTTFDRNKQTIAQLDVPSYTTGPGIQQSSLFLIEEGGALGAMVGEVFATSLEQLEDQEGINPNDYTINPVGYAVRKDQLGSPQERPYKLLGPNGNPIVETIGDINPDFRMGFSHTIGFKGLELYALVDWKKGGDIYNLTKQWLYRDQRHGDFSRYPDVAAGFFGSDGLYNVLVANNHFVEDGSFVMLREAELSYTFRRAGGKKPESIRLSVIGRNLFTLSDYSGFHPDITSVPRDEQTLTNRYEDSPGSDNATPNGDPNLFVVDAFNYPLARTFTFSLQLTF